MFLILLWHMSAILMASYCCHQIVIFVIITDYNCTCSYSLSCWHGWITFGYLFLFLSYLHKCHTCSCHVYTTVITCSYHVHATIITCSCSCHIYTTVITCSCYYCIYTLRPLNRKIQRNIYLNEYNICLIAHQILNIVGIFLFNGSPEFTQLSLNVLVIFTQLSLHVSVLVIFTQLSLHYSSCRELEGPFGSPVLYSKLLILIWFVWVGEATPTPWHIFVPKRNTGESFERVQRFGKYFRAAVAQTIGLFHLVV